LSDNDLPMAIPGPKPRKSPAVISPDGGDIAKKVGRPRKYDRDAITRDVFGRISLGDSVKGACKAYGIRVDVLHDWVRDDDRLAVAYARAREMQAHALAERAIAISRKAYGRDTAGVAAARLEVDTLKWYVSKIAPRLYGERVMVEQEGDHVVRVVFEQPVPARVASPVTDVEDAEWTT
jgi:hypothetical protein